MIRGKVPDGMYKGALNIGLSDKCGGLDVLLIDLVVKFAVRNFIS